MTVLWTTEELPGRAFDPEPDDEDDNGPWCYYPDLWGQRATADQLATMTSVPVTGALL